jgi:general secretion pathway protein H
LGGIRFFPDGSSTGGEIIASNQSDKLKIAVNWISGKVAIFDLEVE